MKATTKRFIQSLGRALYHDQKAEFKTTIDQASSGSTAIHIHTGQYDPAVMIGKNGSMKFAIQNIAAIGLGVPFWKVQVQLESDQESHRIGYVENQSADKTIIEPIILAISELLGAEDVAVEQAETMVACRINLPEPIREPMMVHLHKIVKTSGKANGFAAMIHIGKIENAQAMASEGLPSAICSLPIDPTTPNQD